MSSILGCGRFSVITSVISFQNKPFICALLFGAGDYIAQNYFNEGHHVHNRSDKHSRQKPNVGSAREQGHTRYGYGHGHSAGHTIHSREMSTEKSYWSFWPRDRLQAQGSPTEGRTYGWGWGSQASQRTHDHHRHGPEHYGHKGYERGHRADHEFGHHLAVPGFIERFYYSFDGVRVMEFAVLGGIVGGHLCKVYAFVRSKCKVPGEKFLMTHLCFVPVAYFCLLGGYTILSEGFDIYNITERFYCKYPRIFTLHYCVWPAVNILAATVPKTHAGVLITAASLGFCALLSQEFHTFGHHHHLSKRHTHGGPGGGHHGMKGHHHKQYHSREDQ